MLDLIDLGLVTFLLNINPWITLPGHLVNTVTATTLPWLPKEEITNVAKSGKANVGRVALKLLYDYFPAHVYIVSIVIPPVNPKYTKVEKLAGYNVGISLFEKIEKMLADLLGKDHHPGPVWRIDVVGEIMNDVEKVFSLLPLLKNHINDLESSFQGVVFINSGPCAMIGP